MTWKEVTFAIPIYRSSHSTSKGGSNLASHIGSLILPRRHPRLRHSLRNNLLEIHCFITRQHNMMFALSLVMFRIYGHLCSIIRLGIYPLLDALILFLLEDIKLVRLIISPEVFLLLEKETQVLHGSQTSFLSFFIILNPLAPGFSGFKSLSLPGTRVYYKNTFNVLAQTYIPSLSKV